MPNPRDASALHTDTTSPNENHRFPAARLQHSPSLPNIWFPSHPGQSEMSQVSKIAGQTPSAPPSPKNDPIDALSDKDVRPRHVKYASVDPICRIASEHAGKTHARRRTERDQPHSLLTPPLTPSSSIRTTTSDAASNAKNIPESEENDDAITDREPELTRILLLENVNRQITVDELKAVIISALLEAFSKKQQANDENYTAGAHPFPPEDILRGVNERHLKSKGIIPVIFYDVRIAKLSMEVLTVKNNEHLRACIGDEIGSDGERLGLKARVVTVEELTESLGYSKFLESIDGTFSLAIQQVNQNGNNDEASPPIGKDDLDENSDPSNVTSQSRDGIVKFSMLKTLLRSMGSVRVLKLNRKHVDKDGIVSYVYDVEYHDSRVASIACKELANQVMFGLKMNTLRKMNTVPFPNASTAGESFGGLAIDTAGVHSNMRHRFNFPAISSEQPVREQESLYQPSVNSVPAGAPSPQFFYTTPYGNAPNHAQYPQQEPVHMIGHPMSPAAVSPQPPAMPSHLGFRYQVPNAWDHDVIYRSDTVSLQACYTPDCSYCPSRSPAITQTYAPYAVPCPTPVPNYYPAQVPSNAMPGMVNVAPMTPHPPYYGYDYMDQQLHPVPNAAQWGFDPAIAAVGPGPNHLVPVVGVNGPSPSPFFLRDNGPLVDPRFYQAAQFQHAQPPVAERELGADVSPQPFAHISQVSTPDSSPKSYRSNSVVKYDPSAASTSANANANGPPHNGQQVGERNQLNMTRIAEGVDTRTTVMIKNIPNKMSDTDLTAYIGKVCPRRIDFLYLRMDFKNGCNVGYAFVNFIKVEDLLHFANERLGAKWNMFSSEKVLQMSYANYQGKEALIEKFKNSAIMDEREAWRPRIFYSAGRDQGLPEPFPAPTHIRRKERSSFNRGTLFPPGTNSHNSHHTVLNNTTQRRYNDEYRYLQNRSGFHERPAHLRDGRSGASGAVAASRQTGGAVDKTSGYRGAR